MSYMAVKFLDKEYPIPEDVLTYIELLDFTESVKRQLVNAFIQKLNAEIRKDNVACLDDKDLSVEIEQQVGRFIAKLCDNGIFNRTINDYIRDNKGYQLFSDVNKAALEKMKSLLIREMDSWQAGFEDAMQKKESSVTGMGFSIWSSSFILRRVMQRFCKNVLLYECNALKVRVESVRSGLTSEAEIIAAMDANCQRVHSALNTALENYLAELPINLIEAISDFLSDDMLYAITKRASGALRNRSLEKIVGDDIQYNSFMKRIEIIKTAVEKM